MGRRVMVIGLDCVPPKLLFDRYRSAMPCVSQLLGRGTFGPLRSTCPPITVPAWTSMFSGRDPGELGLYGFRNRRPGTYDLTLATSASVAAPRTWQVAAAAGKASAALFVPPSHPLPRSLPPGCVALGSCFLTPTTRHPHVLPSSLQAELADRFGSYKIDVMNFRSDQRRRILDELYAMGRQHFAIARHVWRNREPELLVMVEIGPDRFHHAFWQAIDPDHPRHLADDPYREEGERYYRFLDEQIESLVSEAGDDTTVILASDHGARPMLGAIALNEWLVQRGYLTLARSVAEPTPPSRLAIDWERTRAWAEGGYYGRLFLNVAGREPRGIVAERDRVALRQELATELATITGLDGEPLAHRVVVPDQAYRTVRGAAPDLMIFLDDLGYRAVGSVGHGRVQLPHNDTGPDGCNHDWEGVFVMAGGGAPQRGRVEGYQLYDVHRTVLGLLDLDAESDLLGVDRSR